MTGLTTTAPAGAVLAFVGAAAGAQGINALVWCDHTAPGFQQPIGQTDPCRADQASGASTPRGRGATAGPELSC